MTKHVTQQVRFFSDPDVKPHSPVGKMTTPVPQKSSILKSLFQHMLKETLWAELETEKILPELISMTCSETLKKAVQYQHAQCGHNVARLSEVFRMSECPEKPTKCFGYEEMVNSISVVIENTSPQSKPRDIGISLLTKKTVQFKHSNYSLLSFMAANIGLPLAEVALSQILYYEKLTDKYLSEAQPSPFSLPYIC